MHFHIHICICFFFISEGGEVQCPSGAAQSSDPTSQQSTEGATITVSHRYINMAPIKEEIWNRNNIFSEEREKISLQYGAKIIKI